MNRKRIRDHRRIPRRFCFTLGLTKVTTWPLLPKSQSPGPGLTRLFHPLIKLHNLITKNGRTVPVSLPSKLRKGAASL